MRKLLILSTFVILFFIYELWISQYQFSIISDELEPQNAQGFYDYRGITHAHTSLGLGSSSPIEVIHAAQEVGLDFLFLTDLNSFESTNRDIAGYHRQTLVFVAPQYSYLDSRLIHYDSLHPSSIGSMGEVQIGLTDLLSQSGEDAKKDLIVLAHPFKVGYSWSGAYPAGLDGIEVINLKSVYQRAWLKYKPSFIWSVLIYPFNSQLAFVRLYSEPRDEVQLWNKLNQSRKVLGFSGSEATARTGSIGDFYFKFPSYQTSFSLVTNHVLLRSELTGDKTKDQQKIMEALSIGQFYMSLDLLGNPKGFSFSLIDDEKTHTMGAEVAWKKGMKLAAHLPTVPNVPYEIQFIKDGDHVMSSSSQDSSYEVHGPGVYRVVVRVIPTLPLPDGKRWISWIYSNPIYIR